MGARTERHNNEQTLKGVPAGTDIRFELSWPGRPRLTKEEIDGPKDTRKKGGA
jgi:hypothetical protein